MADTITNMRQLTIAAVHGHCVGGVVLTAAIFAWLPRNPILNSRSRSRNSPRVGGVPRLVREVGPAVAKTILSCRPFSAEGSATSLSTAWSPMTNSLQRPRLSPNRWRANPHFHCSRQRHGQHGRGGAGTGRRNDADSLVVRHDEDLGRHLSAISNLDLDRLQK